MSSAPRGAYETTSAHRHGPWLRRRQPALALLPRAVSYYVAALIGAAVRAVLTY
ncbi:hypothetical protein [Streptomyces sp. NPDC000851]